MQSLTNDCFGIARVKDKSFPSSEGASSEAGSVVAFLKAAVVHYTAMGVKSERLMTDDGSVYRSRLSNKTCQALGIKHTFAHPHPPTDRRQVRTFCTDQIAGTARRLLLSDALIEC
jgi:hypothetical protein